MSPLRIAFPALLVLALLCVPSNAQSPDDVHVSEFLASNVGGLLDEDGDTSDWIEIHNPGAFSVSLAGWSLTDNAGVPDQWVFPVVSIASGGYLVVFASGKDRAVAGSELHTNFKLAAPGDTVGLFDDGGAPMTLIAPYPPQVAGISYGVTVQPRTPATTRTAGVDGQALPLGGSPDVLVPVYFPEPTPGAPNGAFVFGFLPEPTFSVTRGFYDAPLALTLSSSVPGTTFRFTLDGSPPTETTGFVYGGPIGVPTTAVVRAIAVRDDWISSTVDTHSYVFVDEVLQQPFTIPGYPNQPYDLGSGNSTAVHDHEMDPVVVNDAKYASEMRDAMLAIPTIVLAVDRNEMYGPGGFYDNDDIVEPASIEVLYPDDPAANHQAEAGVEGHSHIRLKRSLRLNFKAEFGNSKFDTTLFQTGPLDGATATGEIDRLILRGGNNRSWARNWNPNKTSYTLDEFYRASQRAVSGSGSRGVFVHLYINGIYWGLYNPVERPDQFFQSSYFDGNEADWFALNHGGPLSGDPTRWNTLSNTLVNLDMSVPTNYADLQEYLELPHFCDYLLVSWYTATSDWPANNWYGGNRNDTSGQGTSPHRYFAWDGEWSWDTTNGIINPSGQALVHPLFESDKSGGPTLAALWHAARANDEFMILFADRVAAAIENDGPLSDAGALARWQTVTGEIQSAILGESARWGDCQEALGGPTRTRDDHWQPHVDTIAALIPGNADVLIAALRAEGYYPTIDPPGMTPFGGQVAAGSAVTLANPNASGTLYYTLDGSDPRATGGGVSGNALAYGGPIGLLDSAQIITRVLDGTTWSAKADADFTIIAQGPPVRITEIMYNPPDPSPSEIAAGFTDSDEFEFLELANLSGANLSITDFSITGGVTFTFGTLVLPPGGFALVVENEAAFEERYGPGLPVAGQYIGKLANGGEALLFATGNAEVVQSFAYDDEGGWPTPADGGGSSLMLVNLIGDPNDPSSWAASAAFGGTPGSN